MIEVATREQIRQVALNMRDRDFAEFRATSFLDSREALASDLVRRYGGRDDVLCASRNGSPICIGGTIETWPGVMTLLFFATPRFPRVANEVASFIRDRLFPGYFAAGIHRVQTITMASYEEVQTWMHALGMRQEGSDFEHFGRNGENFRQFVRLRDDYPACAAE